MPPKRPCRFYQEGKCWKGPKCDFPHVGPDASSAPRQPTGAGRSSTPGKGPNFIAGLPRETCREYWEKGTCDKGFECRFKHVAKPSTGQPLAAGPAAPQELVETALERISESYTDAFAAYALTPSEAHNYMRTFLVANYKFRNADDMQRFVSVLNSVNTTNNAWSFPDGQEFLALIANIGGEGLLRMQDILLYNSVSPNGKLDRTALSFQRGYVPMLSYFGSEYVTKSTLNHNVNALYGLIEVNFDVITSTLRRCIEVCMNNRSFGEPDRPLSGLPVFRTVTTCLYEYATRFQKAVSSHPSFVRFVQDLLDWTNTWETDIRSSRPQFQDPMSTWSIVNKDFALDRLKSALNILVDVVERAEGSTFRRPQTLNLRGDLAAKTAATLSNLAMTHEGPGDLRPGGKRHDNDFERIGDIRVVPTHSELSSIEDPCLPANIPGAPHHLPGDSMDRLVDVHFRLLREEFVSPIRSSLEHVLHDLDQPPPTKTQTKQLLNSHGGMYRAAQGAMDSVMFMLYTDVRFEGMKCDIHRGVEVRLRFHTPPGKARLAGAGQRKAYWEGVGRKRLMQGGLLTLLWKSRARNDVRLYLGVITSHLEDLIKSSRSSADHLTISVSFFEAEAELRIIRRLHQGGLEDGDQLLLIEAPIMFEGIRPFLETLRSRPPSDIPFAKYLAHPLDGDLSDVVMTPPVYATPTFKFDLSMLFDVQTRLSLKPNDPDSIQEARDLLKEDSRLDESQADAMVDALTSEVSLIQGPPGTGKSYTGIELLRVLIANKVQPVLLIAFTNHALDNIISQVLEKDITNKVIRLGGRSAEPLIAERSLENVMKTRNKSRADKAAGRAFGELKDLQKQLDTLMQEVVDRGVKDERLHRFLAFYYPEHNDQILNPPHWISEAFREQQGWMQQGKAQITTLMQYWRDGGDIKFITPPAQLPPSAWQADYAQPSRSKGKGPMISYAVLREQESSFGTDSESGSESSSESVSHSKTMSGGNTRHSQPVLDPYDLWVQNLTNFFSGLNLQGLPDLPSTSRALQELLDDDDPNPWRMSLSEREDVYTHWVDRLRESDYLNQTQEFERLKQRHADAKSKHTEIQDQTKLEVLRNAELIGCTTNGAAKLTSLLKGVAPKVMVVEEAGQVLEAHILASLVPSIQHVVLIGDPQQLRPTIENYQLSMDNPQMGAIYRLDQSLMERLSSMGLHMSRIDVQRRMRPRVSNLIRVTLYPELVDSDTVLKYPSIRGMAKNVFFLDHRHPEDGAGEDSSSKTNTFEALMIKELVLYFLKQGKYTKQGDIVVLCAYLGQLTKIRKALSSIVTTVIDERDADQLIGRGEEDELLDGVDKVAEQVQVTSRVLLRTVDNFQGEEGTIIILSLVRNSGSDSAQRPNIGFLKSPNRANVALSRAREGLYILGNAADLSSRSGMWKQVVEELKEHHQIGPAFPLACVRHRTPNFISRPEEIALYAPDGGCTQQCTEQLKCGHLCHLKCHSDDEGHLFTLCIKDCSRMCPRGHPCLKRCSDPCGNCPARVSRRLDCGHVNEIACWQQDDLGSVRCVQMVEKPLPSCEHSAFLPCAMDPNTVTCGERCDLDMLCCNKKCTSTCGQCQKVNGNGGILRQKHTPHPCTKPLACHHSCPRSCTDGHDCSEIKCKSKCRQGCPHTACTKACSEPCAPCLEACTWICEHQTCSVVCGAPCARLPCDQRCNKDLSCGHRCPSVCGEPCELQLCPLCAPEHQQRQIVDVIMQTTLGEVDPDGESIDELLITLDCRHVFTVETLDGITELQKYYKRKNGRWTGLATPPAGLQKAPLCPLCRSPIKSLRYGRVFKRADLDMSEQNVARHSRMLVRDINRVVVKFDAKQAETVLRKAVDGMKPSDSPADGAPDEEERIASSSLKFPKISIFPVPVNRLRLAPRSKRPTAGIPQLAEAWGKAFETLMTRYKSVCEVANSRAAHAAAYEAAVGALYRDYLDRIVKPDDLPRGITPETMALQMAQSGCGLTPPKADKRFKVEACWTSFTIRFQMADAAQTVSDAINAKDPSKAAWSEWSEFIDYVLRSVVRDAELVIEVADSSRSHRQAVRTTLFLLEAQYRVYDHQVAWKGAATAKVIQELKDGVLKGCAKAKKLMAQRSHTYRSRPEADLEEQAWLHENFVIPGEAIVEKWVSLSDRINRGHFYEPVSDEEKREILKAFTSGFLGIQSGRWYQCPEGHVYVITECGRAMQESRCPECGRTIGGGRHTLNSTNSVSRYFDNL